MKEKQAISKCQLILTGIQQKSKAKKLFWLFRPSECIYWEPFDLSLSFKNVSTMKFEGGRCSFLIWGENTHKTANIAFPTIEPNEVATISISNGIVGEVSTTWVTKIEVQDKDGKAVLCKDSEGKDTNREDWIRLLRFVTKEEVYQKYAVVVALFFSILASILTIINVLVAIS